MGAKHGWAMCTLTEDGRLEWPSPPVELGIGPSGGFDLGEIVRRLSGSNEPMGAGQRVVVAMVHVRRWCEADGPSVRPWTDDGASDREIIGVYPALAKDPRSREAKGRLSALLPPDDLDVCE